METLDGLGYITAGFSFLLLGMVVFAHAWYTFLKTLASGVLPAALTLIHDLLLVVILLELFRTIINFLKTHIITLEPFLYICIIASTRRILTTGASMYWSSSRWFWPCSWHARAGSRARLLGKRNGGQNPSANCTKDVI